MTWTKDQIHSMLDSKPKAVAQAIVAIYKRQTNEEKAARVTRDSNGVGFSSYDAEFLTSLAEFYQKAGFLTPAQLARGRNKIKRYWRQLIEIADASGKQPPAKPDADQLPTTDMIAAKVAIPGDWS